MITDALVLIFLLAFVFWGTKRGAMKMLLSILGLVVSVLAGMFLYKPLSGLFGGLREGLALRLSEDIDAMTSLPGIMRDFIAATGADSALAGAMADAAVGALTFLSVVVLARLLLAVTGAVMGVAGSLPVIKQANGLLGGMIGFIEGTVTLFVIFGVIAVAEALGRPGLVGGVLDGSHIAAIIYNNNPLLGLVVSAANVIK